MRCPWQRCQEPSLEEIQAGFYKASMALGYDPQDIPQFVSLDLCSEVVHVARDWERPIWRPRISRPSSALVPKAMRALLISRDRLRGATEDPGDFREPAGRDALYHHFHQGQHEHLL